MEHRRTVSLHRQRQAAKLAVRTPQLYQGITRSFAAPAPKRRAAPKKQSNLRRPRTSPAPAAAHPAVKTATRRSRSRMALERNLSLKEFTAACPGPSHMSR